MSNPVQPLSPEQQPRGGCVVLLAPTLMIGGLILGYAGLFVAGIVGRAPTGERVTVRFEACPEARPLLVARVEEMGLGAPEWSDVLDPPDGFRLVATYPADPVVAAAIPGTLATTGALSAVWADGVAVDLPVESAIVRLDASANPRSAVVLTPAAKQAFLASRAAHPNEVAVVRLDGVEVGRIEVEDEFEDGQVDLPGPDGTLADAMRVVAARTLTLNRGPLPCPVTPLRVPTDKAQP